MCRTTNVARSERRTRPLRTWTRSRSPRARRFAPQLSSRWSSSWSRIDAAPVSCTLYTASIKRRWVAQLPVCRSIVVQMWVRHPVQVDPCRRWPPWVPTMPKRNGTKCQPTVTGAYHDQGFFLSIDKVDCLSIVHKYLPSIEFTILFIPTNFILKFFNESSVVFNFTLSLK